MRSLVWKRVLLISCVMCQSLLLTGCWDRIELVDLALVKAAAIDKTKDNKIEISAEVLIPRSAGGGQSGGQSSASSKGTIVRSATGENLADAISKLQEKLPRKIFWGHAKAFIFGESFAKQGIRRELDYLSRDIGVRERSFVFVSEGQAKKMIEVNPPIERNEAEVLRKLAESNVVMGATLLEFLKGINGHTQAAIMPIIRLLAPTESGKQKNAEIAYIDKVAIFKKDKMVGKVDDETSRGVQWLINNVQTPIITIHPKENKGTISMKMLHAQTKLVPEIKDGKWKMLIKGETEDDIIQNATQLDTMNPYVINQLEKELGKDIAERMYQALNQIQKGMKTDVFRFGNAFHRTYPKEWEKAKKHWDRTFPQVEVQVQIRAHILRPGLSSKPMISEDKEKEK